MTDIEFPGVQLSWERILAIAQAQPDPIVAKDILFNDLEPEPEQEQTTFNRMQCMNKALQNIYTITSQDQGYIAFMVTMVTELKFQCPISMAFLKHVIDFSEIPTKQTLEHVTEALLTKATTKQTKTNAAIIWSMLAQKFAGSLAESIWTDDLGNMLIQCLCQDINIYSLLALESFALTGTLKRSLMHQYRVARVIQQLLHSVDKSMCSIPQSPLPSLESVATTSPDLTLVSIKHHIRIYKELKSAFKLCKSKLAKKRKSFRKSQNWNYKSICNDIEQLDIQVQQEQENALMFLDLRKLHFCLSWSLNNVFTKPTNVQTPIPYQSTYMEPVDENSHCKFSTDRLQVRNDTFFFESVRATTGISSATGGKWYYEVILFTDGIMQIGWGTTKCLLSSQDGSGIGDDAFGFAFDTHRCAVWAAGDLHLFPNAASLVKCKAGDVLGCLLDLTKNWCTFFINGQDYGFGISISKSTLPYYPTISLTGHQQVLVNFGQQPWCYGMAGAKSVNEAASITILTKPKNKTTLQDDDSLCNICYSEPINAKLYPCEHSGFGENCAQTFESWQVVYYIHEQYGVDF